MSFQRSMDGRIKVFVDGCYQPGNPRAGAGIWFNHGHHLNKPYQIVAHTKTSNDIEFEAAQLAIQLLPDQELLIYTDSQFVIDNTHRLQSRSSVTVQRIDQRAEGIREADKLARMGAGLN